jgi:hypothetical protein
VPRRPNAFSGPYLDRAAHLRKDTAFLQQARHAAASRIVPIHKSRNLVRRGPAGWSAVYLEASADLSAVVPDAEYVLLGRFDDVIYFAAEFGEAENVAATVVPPATGAGSRHPRVRARHDVLAPSTPVLWRLRSAQRIGQRWACHALYECRLCNRPFPAPRSGDHRAGQ